MVCARVLLDTHPGVTGCSPRRYYIRGPNNGDPTPMIGYSKRLQFGLGEHKANFMTLTTTSC